MKFHSDNGSGFINHVITGWHRNPVCPHPLYPLKGPQEK
jgi:hypothetical protein